MDAWTLRKHFNVVLDKIVRELHDVAYLDFEHEIEPMQDMCSSRFLGIRLRELPPI
ncbi:MAG: hypothetical protein ACN6P0_14155 [Pseudomonas capeferrum]|jgi:DNA polymerase V|uniref:hypothetical protein n=1 Tax=Pseudomonas capeferrum TaxID=1495066 RepID=UPI003D117561